jgi:hypothetical protein
MLTVLPDTVQTPAVPVIDGVVLALVVAVTENVDIYAAVTGAPVKDTVGAVEFTICISAAEELPAKVPAPL